MAQELRFVAFQLGDERPHRQQENPAVPEMVAALQIALSRGAIRLLDEGGDPVRAPARREPRPKRGYSRNPSPAGRAQCQIAKGGRSAPPRSLRERQSEMPRRRSMRWSAGASSTRPSGFDRLTMSAAIGRGGGRVSGRRLKHDRGRSNPDLAAAAGRSGNGAARCRSPSAARRDPGRGRGARSAAAASARHVSGKNCFGWFSRESGHSREPAPPDNSTG